MRRFATLVIFSLCAVTWATTSPAVAQNSPALVVEPAASLVDGEVVTLEGTGFAASATVYFCQGSITANPSPSDCGTPVQATLTDAAGSFAVSVAVHRYLARSDGTITDCADGVSSCGFGATTLGATPPVVAPVTFDVLPPGPDPFRATGVVTDASGTALAGVDVWAYRSTDGWVGSQRTRTATDGSFALEDLIPNVGYRVKVLAPQTSNLVSQWIASNPAGSPYRNQYSSEVRLTAAVPSVVLTAQLHASATIEGDVTTSSGVGVAAVAVAGFLPDDIWVGAHAATTDAAGHYRIEGVWPGLDVIVRFQPPSGSGLATEWHDDVTLRRKATPVVLAAGEVVSVDAQLSASGPCRRAGDDRCTINGAARSPSDRAAHSPVKSGGRFSLKARMPSLASLLNITVAA
jgi:hypothetical protein